ncbi:MAG: pyridoxal phosphate-dependent aminotransferase [Myxococcota bacterium]
MSTRIAQRLLGVTPSATLALAERARQMKAQGIDVVSLTAGEPDFRTAPHVIAAAEACHARGAYRYTAVAGIPELRQAIKARIEAEHGVSYAAEEILVGAGAKQAIMNAMLALVERGDEVLIVAPYWLSYWDMTLLAEGTPKLLRTSEDQGFRLRPEALSDAITEKTRLFILNSPSNPAGATYSRAHLEALAAVLRRHPGVLILLDDIYGKICFSPEGAQSFLAVAPDLVDRIIHVDGASKTYAMTGFRIGWAAAKAPMIGAMTRVQAQTTSCATAPSQYAALAALTGDQRWVGEMVRTYDERRRFVIERLRAIPGLSCFDPGGAFYALPSIRPWLGRALPDGRPVDAAEVLVEYLLREHRVVTVPGTPFGAPEHLRLSFATDQSSLERGLERIAAGLASLR